MPDISASDRFNKAVLLEKKGDYKNALIEYALIIHNNPDYREAYINLGSLFARTNKLPEAMKYYKAALSLGSDYITFFNVGCLLYKMGSFREAIPNLERSYAMNKSFMLAKLVSALCYSRLNRLATAEKLFSDVLKKWPDNQVASTALAMIYLNHKKFKKSLQLMDKVLQLDTGNVKIRKLKSDILFELGRFDETAAEIKIIKQKDDTYKQFTDFLKSVPVEIYTDKYGSIDDKIKSLQNKIHENSSSLISLSLCHLLKGETDAAIDYLFKYKKNS